MKKVIPIEVMKQIASIEHESSLLLYPDTISKRIKRYKDRLLTFEEISLGYHKCQVCGFPTKNYFKCHGCWHSEMFYRKVDGSFESNSKSYVK
jgi:uncharacterized protein (UPF0212 family)